MLLLPVTYDKMEKRRYIIFSITFLCNAPVISLFFTFSSISKGQPRLSRFILMHDKHGNQAHLCVGCTEPHWKGLIKTSWMGSINMLSLRLSCDQHSDGLYNQIIVNEEYPCKDFIFLITKSNDKFGKFE